jgi:hypothetical protein
MWYVDLDPMVFILHFASQLCIASKLVSSLHETMTESLSVAITAVFSAKDTTKIHILCMKYSSSMLYI